MEAFYLDADDLKYVTTHFRRLHSKDLQNVLRYHSHHWRTWAAMSIQVGTPLASCDYSLVYGRRNLGLGFDGERV